MGEIKSTLDLIMEKTKNLRVSDEEKRGFKRQELAGKVKGLVQRTLDGLITGERFREEIAALRRESGAEPLLNRLLMEELTGRMELGREADAYLELLESITFTDLEPLRAVVRKYSEKGDLLRESCEESQVKKLEQLGFAGSAVMFNLNANGEWKEAVHRLQEQLTAELREKAEDLI